MSSLSALVAANSQSSLQSRTGSYYLIDYYQVSDGTVTISGTVYPDYYLAFNRIQDLLTHVGQTALVQLPAGYVAFSTTLNIYKSMHIRGTSPGYNVASASPTAMVWPKNMTGVRCWSGAEVNVSLGPAYGPYPGPAGYSSANGLIEDTQILCLDNTTTSGHGVHISSSFRMNRVNVQGFGEDGVRIFAYNPAQGGINAGTGQADIWYISDSIIRSNKGNGLFVQGADTNAGVAHMVLGGNNSLWDFVDRSYLGNTYIGCQSDGGGLGSYKGGVGSTYVGCYNESKALALDSGTLIIGGVLGPESSSPTLDVAGDGTDAAAVVLAVDPTTGKVTSILPVLFGSGYTTATISVGKQGDGSGLVVTATVADGNIVGGHITSYKIVNGGTGYQGWANSPTVVRASGAGINTNGPLVVKNYSKLSARTVQAILCSDAQEFLTGRVYGNNLIDYENFNCPVWRNSISVYDFTATDNNIAIRIVSKYATTQRMGRASQIAAGSMQFPSGFWLGGGNVGDASLDSRYIGNGTAAPTVGEWARGDIIYNITPTSGGFVGWICTAAGTPGTWKTFGAIS